VPGTYDTEVKSICKVLYKTPPAITCRLNKYQKVFGDEFFTYSQIMRRRELSDNGRAVAGQAKKALNVLLGEEHISIGTLLNIR
jgi:hypothetical protein